MSISLDRTGGRQVLPDGVYKLRASKVPEEKMGPSGSPYLVFTWEVLDRSGKPNGTLIFDNLSLNPKARFRVDALLDAIGAPPTGKIEYSWFKGKTVSAMLTSETYNGKVKNAIAQFLPAEVAAQQAKKAPVKAAALEDDEPVLAGLPAEMDEDDDDDALL
jgi:hypothetical protein